MVLKFPIQRKVGIYLCIKAVSPTDIIKKADSRTNLESTTEEKLTSMLKIQPRSPGFPATNLFTNQTDLLAKFAK